MTDEVLLVGSKLRIADVYDSKGYRAARLRMRLGGTVHGLMWHGWEGASTFCGRSTNVYWDHDDRNTPVTCIRCLQSAAAIGWFHA